jgi:hypothetical protein
MLQHVEKQYRPKASLLPFQIRDGVVNNVNYKASIFRDPGLFLGNLNASY